MVLCLHGGGYSGYAQSSSVIEFKTKITSRRLISCFTMDRLSFGLAASKLKQKARVVAMDLRGHGKSSTENDLDLSIEVGFIHRNNEVIVYLFYTILFSRVHQTFVSFCRYVFTFQTLCNDVIALVKAMYGDSPPAIILVGHRYL